LAESHLELKELTAYPFWLAMYTDEMTYPYRVDFWQYSDCGRIPGIEGDVDLNIWMPRS
jgi:GH25 family lysozyme M1 (1,4-beta-N-acetylmuramidase)